MNIIEVTTITWFWSHTSSQSRRHMLSFVLFHPNNSLLLPKQGVKCINFGSDFTPRNGVNGWRWKSLYVIWFVCIMSNVSYTIVTSFTGSSNEKKLSNSARQTLVLNEKDKCFTNNEERRMKWQGERERERQEEKGSCNSSWQEGVVRVYGG